MTQEDKQLLLRDLCARLPYGVKISVLNGKTLWTLTGMFESEYTGTMLIVLPPNPPKHSSPKTSNWSMKDCKPYLRPISSMTHSEYDEYLRIKTHGKPFEVIDWLNARHIDYRKLIDKGLAIAVTDENNPYKI